MLRKDDEAIYSLSTGSGSKISVQMPLAIKVDNGGAPALSIAVYHVTGHSDDSHAWTIQNMTIYYCIRAAITYQGYHAITQLSSHLPQHHHHICRNTITLHSEVEVETTYYDPEAFKPHYNLHWLAITRSQ